MLTLTLRTPSPVPLELDEIVPGRIANLPATEVAKLPVQHGNRSEPLGEFFDATGDPSDSRLRLVGDLRNVHGVGTKMADGSITVEGPVGRHAGAGMTGGELVVEDDAGDWLGAEMRGGLIRVRGSVGHQAGAAYRGSRRGMAGGTILIHGDAGDELGLLMRRGLIAVGGRAGAFAGASLIAGSLFLLGGAGGRLGAGMKRGTIVVAGEPDLPPGFRFACEYRPPFLAVYRRHLAALGMIRVDRSEWGMARCYRGDLATGGRGEVLVV